MATPVMRAFILVTVIPTLTARIINIYPESDLTCYTCPKKHNNRACNRWAPDVPCPPDHSVCKTVHRFNVRTGRSVSVEKLCALPEHCGPAHIGCQETGNRQHIECVSCCTVSYCNKQAPSNVTSPADLSLSVLATQMSSDTPPSIVISTTVGFLMTTCTMMYQLTSLGG